MPTEHDYIDVHDLFVSINPSGLDEKELERNGASFVEPQTINEYHLFHAGYQAALEAQKGQGEPVGYQIRSKTDRPGSQWMPWRECCDTERALHSHEVGRFNQFGIMREIRPVFASAADPAEVERLRTENIRLNGLRPEGPPRPPAGDGLPRYGLRWNGPQQPIAVPMNDGYWTPWHLADRLRQELNNLLEAGAHLL
ncbi:hypothetical protein G7Z99_02625 [Pseudomonas entomophila]|uniref:hypothetical protein n=1 Tax=Pseudomonas entomophila TaxID=312306 RepID=UPI0015E3B0DD|nr:hypothetical protein [Pseudomonas entomophila]MBA1187934.1 hypothetical protein [Pseudomonas entomophila]